MNPTTETKTPLGTPREDITARDVALINWARHATEARTELQRARFEALPYIRENRLRHARSLAAIARGYLVLCRRLAA